MPFDLSVWELSRLLVAVLLGIALVAVPAALLLIRARRRESRLRRQVARLTTAQALLNPNRSGSGQRDTVRQGSAVPAQQIRDGAEADTGRAGESARESEPLPAAAVADIPEAPGSRARPAEATTSAQVPIQLDHPDPDPPTQPEPASGQQREAGVQSASAPADPPLGSEESAERFRRDYTDPMTEHRKRLADLRSQLNDDSADQEASPVHNN